MVYDTYETDDATYYITDSIDIPDLPRRYVIITERRISCPSMPCNECIMNEANTNSCTNMASVSDVIRQYFPTFCTSYPELLI